MHFVHSFQKFKFFSIDGIPNFFYRTILFFYFCLPLFFKPNKRKDQICKRRPQGVYTRSKTWNQGPVLVLCAKRCYTWRWMAAKFASHPLHTAQCYFIFRVFFCWEKNGAVEKVRNILYCLLVLTFSRNRNYFNTCSPFLEACHVLSEGTMVSANSRSYGAKYLPNHKYTFSWHGG